MIYILFIPLQDIKIPSDLCPFKPQCFNILGMIAMFCFGGLQARNVFNRLLRGMDTLSGEATVKCILLPFWNRIYSKRKEFAPTWSKFFPFKVDLFSEGTRCTGKQTRCHESCLPSKIDRTGTKCL